LAFQNDNYYINDKELEALKTKHKSGVPDKTSGFDHITEAGGYCVFKKFIRISQVL
jgi:hypothetical protein